MPNNPGIRKDSKDFTKFYPVRRWNQKLVAIGNGVYRTLESFDWHSIAQNPAAVRATQRGNSRIPKDEIIRNLRQAAHNLDLDSDEVVILATNHDDSTEESITVTPHNDFVPCSNDASKCVNCPKAHTPEAFLFESPTAHYHTPSPPWGRTHESDSSPCSPSAPPALSPFFQHLIAPGGFQINNDEKDLASVRLRLGPSGHPLPQF